MKKMENRSFGGERALFASTDTALSNCVFTDGESPLKESSDIALRDCLFHWRYPLWYGKRIAIDRCSFFADTRAGLWYTDDLTVRDSVFDSPKNLRRCSNILLENVRFTDGAETLWHCKDVTMRHCLCRGDYFAMNSENLLLEDFTLVGKYSFDGVKNCTVKNAHMITKDAFWNAENVTVYDSFISAEYIGWNSKNLTLINCTVESLQGFCYIENLKLVNCRLPNTTLAFEYCTVDAEIDGKIESVINPKGGVIRADSIGELILEADRIDPTQTEIICKKP